MQYFLLEMKIFLLLFHKGVQLHIFNMCPILNFLQWHITSYTILERPINQKNHDTFRSFLDIHFPCQKGSLSKLTRGSLTLTGYNFVQRWHTNLKVAQLFFFNLAI